MEEEQKKLAEELIFADVKYPSFVKQLYFGRFDAKTVFPFPELPVDEAFVQKVMAFAKEKVDPDQIDRKAEIPENVIEGLGKLGVLGMTIPKEYGGLGKNQTTYCKLMEELAAHCGSTALFVNAHQSVGLKALLLFGTEEQKRRYLPSLARGEEIAAFSLTEKNAGSDASNVEMTATYDASCDTYLLNGKKQWTTNGCMAKVLTVMARTEEGITAFLVTPDMPGFKVTIEGQEKVGMRGTKTSHLSFDNVAVPAKNILGPKGKGLKVCLTVLDYGRTTFGATCTGGAKYALKRAVEYSKERIQFKRSLASFDLIKKKLVQISSLTYAMDATTYLTAGMVDREVEDFMLEAACLKVFASESLWTILYETMQIFGGKSFFTDEPFERMMRDARLNMIGEGANEVLRAFIGVVGMRDVGEQLKASPFSHLFSLLGKSKEAKELKNCVQMLARGVAKALFRYREEIVEKQLLLNRIAESVIALYTATAVLGKLEKEKDPVQRQVGRWYVKQAIATCHCCLSSLFYEGDKPLLKLADAITGLK